MYMRLYLLSVSPKVSLFYFFGVSSSFSSFLSSECDIRWMYHLVQGKQLFLLTTERTVRRIHFSLFFSFFFSFRLFSFQQESMMFHHERQRQQQRHVRFQLPTTCSIERGKSQWTCEKFNDLFNRFKCSVTATYWQSLRERVEKTNFRLTTKKNQWRGWKEQFQRGDQERADEWNLNPGGAVFGQPCENWDHSLDFQFSLKSIKIISSSKIHVQIKKRLPDFSSNSETILRRAFRKSRVFFFASSFSRTIILIRSSISFEYFSRWCSPHSSVEILILDSIETVDGENFDVERRLTENIDEKINRQRTQQEAIRVRSRSLLSCNYLQRFGREMKIIVMFDLFIEESNEREKKRGGRDNYFKWIVRISVMNSLLFVLIKCARFFSSFWLIARRRL